MATQAMRIGELARDLGVTPDTIRFYERSGFLPRPQRSENGYRAYAATDIERLRLLVELRRLDLPLDLAARLAGWCATGHCAETTRELPEAIAGHRGAIERRIVELHHVADRLGGLERHLRSQGRALRVLGEPEPCCAAAAAVTGVAGA